MLSQIELNQSWICCQMPFCGGVGGEVGKGVGAGVGDGVGVGFGLGVASGLGVGVGEGIAVNTAKALLLCESVKVTVGLLFVE